VSATVAAAPPCHILPAILGYAHTVPRPTILCVHIVYGGEAAAAAAAEGPRALLRMAEREELLRWAAGRMTPELSAKAAALQDPTVVKALLKIKRRVSEIEQQPMGTVAAARSAAAQQAGREATARTSIGPSATGLLIGSARITARDADMETTVQEQQRTCKVHAGYVQTARLQKKSDEPQRVPDSSRSVNSDVFNYIYKTGDLAAQQRPKELRNYNRNIQHQLDTAYGQGKPRAGAVADDAFDPYDHTNQCWPWRAATQNKQHWLQGRADGSMSPFVPFEKQD
jgi:DNA-binding CsgD family transcriptional regulator